MVIDGTPYIDGGVWDHAGLMAMPEAIRAADVKGGSGISNNNNSDSRINIEYQDGDCGDNSVVDVRAADCVDTNNDANVNDDDSDDSDVNHGNSSSTVTNLIEASKTDIDDVPSTETTTTHHPPQHQHHHHHPLRKLVVNIIFGRSYISTSKLPVELSTHKVRMMSLLFIDIVKLIM